MLDDQGVEGWRHSADLVQRGRLMSFREVADLCARKPGSVARDEDLRQQTLQDIAKSIARGEFGPPMRPLVVYLPEIVPSNWPKGWWSRRLTAYQIHHLWELIGTDLWAPRSLCAQWLGDRQLHVPRWLADAQPTRAAFGRRVAPMPSALEPPAIDRELATVAQNRPAPNDKAVRQWMRDRVKNWPENKPAPSEEEDWTAVCGHFAPGLRRDDFRIVRLAETPDAWRKQGPRRNWGVAKRA